MLAVIFICGMAAGGWMANSIAERERVALRFDHLKQLESIQAAHQRTIETLARKTERAAVTAEGAAATADVAAEKAGKASVKAEAAATATARISRGQAAVQNYLNNKGGSK